MLRNRPNKPHILCFSLIFFEKENILSKILFKENISFQSLFISYSGPLLGAAPLKPPSYGPNIVKNKLLAFFWGPFGPFIRGCAPKPPSYKGALPP